MVRPVDLAVAGEITKMLIAGLAPITVEPFMGAGPRHGLRAGNKGRDWPPLLGPAKDEWLSLCF